MTYKYKIIPISGNLTIEIRRGKDLGVTLAQYIETKINEMAQKGWEFYRMDNYTAQELVGCLASIFGHKGGNVSYNLLVFRKEA